MKFTDELKRRSQPIWNAIFDHPFIKELGNGTLSNESFFYFIVQDWLYLQAFSRVLCILASKAVSTEYVKMFAEHAAFAVEVESSMHPKLAKEKGLPFKELEKAQRAPITQAYTRHLLTVAHEGSFAEAVAAVIPCYWTYLLVGKRLTKSIPNDPVYAEWIKLYDSEDFGKTVAQVLELINKLSKKIDKREKMKIIENYMVSLKYEYLFWDQAYHLKSWPL
ncbi:thiaminase II [Candidatus Bathyarchaeota archaeon]|nr:thiaminase II [Candidatus Bathyarchaeota archaeon]